MKYVPLLLLFVLVGCAAVPIPFNYDDSLNAREAATAVDRALMTQPPNFRPESVDVTPEYVMYGKGTISRGRNSLLVVPIGNVIAVGRGRSSTTSKNLIERIYFDTYSEAKLYRKRRLFVVMIYSNDRQPVKRFYLYNEEQARALINSLHSLKRLSSQPAGNAS